MMMSGRNGMSLGGPGQREVSHKDLATEVDITLAHTKWAALAGFILGLVLRYGLIAPVAQAIVNQWPNTAAQIIPAEAWLSWRFVLLCTFASVAMLWVSFCIQVFNVNFPPPYSAANPALGFFGGMFLGKHEAPAYQEYPGSAPTVDAREVTANLLLGTKGQSRPVVITLPLDDWTRLRRYVEKGQRSVSEADLVKFGGFSSGPNGRARAVNEALKRYAGATEKGRKGKPCIVAPLADWILARGYGADNPTLPQIKAV